MQDVRGANDKVNVLLVDDQPAKLLAYEVILKDLGETLVIASSGREALEILLKTEIAVILVDVCMPELDGFELAAMIRENPALARLPIIALTAKAMKGDREKCLEAGASDYLAKPVNTEQLLLAIRMWLHR